MDERIIDILQDIQNHLVKHDARFDRLDVRIDQLDNRMDNLENRMDNLESRMDNIENGINNLEKRVDTLETSVREDIKLLGHELHIEIQAVYDNVEELRSDIGTMEMLTTKNAFDIAKLKLAR